jgi:transcriptional regulator with XRE-family HTH domain
MAEGATMVEPIAERLRRLRLERGLSQRELAEPGVTPAYISRIEAGARQPSLKVVRMLADRLGVSEGYLETGVDPKAEEWAREFALGEAELELRLAEDPTEVEERLRTLRREAVATGNDEFLTRTSAALGLAAFRRGHHAEAAAHLEQAVGSGLVSPLSQPDLYGTLGRCYVSSGRTKEAVALFERCLVQVERSGPETEASYIRFATYLSYALSDMGELTRARTVLRGALDRSDLVDPYARVRLYWSQARLAAAEGDPATALLDLRRAIALLETTEDTRQLGRAHLLYAEILTFEGDAEEARPHLELAESFLGTHPDGEDAYWLRTEQARCAAELGDAEEAIRRATEALELIGDADPAERGAAYRALGEGLAAAGDLEAATDALRVSVELLSRECLWAEASQAARSRARLLREAGRDAEAFSVLEHAADLAIAKA